MTVPTQLNEARILSTIETLHPLHASIVMGSTQNHTKVAYYATLVPVTSCIGVKPVDAAIIRLFQKSR